MKKRTRKSWLWTSIERLVDQEDAAMINRKSKRLFGSNPLITVAIVIYFGVGYGLIKKFWPDSDVGLWILITVGMVGYVFVLWLQRDRG